jgi:putative CocE/NonD family hydrolase
MSTDDSSTFDGIDRRTVLQSLGAATVLGAGVGSGYAQSADQPPRVRGSVEQVLVTDVVPEATVTLYGPDGQQVAQAQAQRPEDPPEWLELASYAFRDIDPGEGYQVTQTVDGTESPRSQAVRVLPRDYEPPQELYDRQTLTEGFGYFETRDGTKLAHQVKFPEGEPPYPVIIDYSGYEPSVNFWDGIDNAFLDRGYAVAGVNKRGTACSGGKFDFMEPLHWLDGYDMVEVIAAQDWADGVGLAGKSYPGYTQLYVAATQPPSLDAIAPGHPVGDFYRDVGYPGGMLNTTFAGVWANGRDTEAQPGGDSGNVDERIADGDETCEQNQQLRSQNVPLLPRMENTPFDTGLFQERSPWPLIEQIEVPSLVVVAWQDEQTGGRAARLLEQYSDDVDARFVGTNGDHGEYYGPEVFSEISRFFSYKLKGEVPEGDEGPFEDALSAYNSEDPVTIYWEMDHERSPRFQTTHATWPPDASENWELYCQPDGSLAPDPPDATGERSPYRFTSPGTFLQQVPTESGQMQWKQLDAEKHTAFVSEQLDEEKVCLGSGMAELWLRSSADDTELEVSLSEVRPDGQEMYVQSGWLRASHRAEDAELSKPRRPWHTHKPDDQEPLSDEFERLRVELFPFGHTFREGSRLKLTIQNPGGNRTQWGFKTAGAEATNEIGHGEAMPSRVVLPELPEMEAGASERPECGSVRFQPCREVDVDSLVGLPEFAVRSIDPESATTSPGEPMTLTVDVENSGDAQRAGRVELRIDGTTVAHEVIAPGIGETATATFSDLDLAADRDAGEYEPVIWTEDDQRSMTLTVEGGTDESDSSDQTDDGSDSSDQTDGESDSGNQTDGESGDGSGPGFGVGTALASLGGAGYLLKQRLGERENDQ